MSESKDDKSPNFKEIEKENSKFKIQTFWKDISENYECIEGAQLSNSFIILLTPDLLKDPSSWSDISKAVSEYRKGRINKPVSTLKDSLEKRLRREEYVKGIEISNRTNYSVMPKGRKLLKGWISFLEAIQ